MGILINVYGTWQLFVKENDNIFNIVILSLGETIADLGFCVSHWVFAARYYLMGIQMPYVVEGKSLPEDQQQRFALLYKVLLVLNFVCPVLESAVLIPFNIMYFKGEQYSAFFSFVAACVPILPGVLEIISGVYLIKGLAAIRKFYKEKNMENEMDTRTTRLHAWAFLLYIGITVIGYTSYALYVIF
jgi:hypothetical protein